MTNTAATLTVAQQRALRILTTAGRVGRYDGSGIRIDTARALVAAGHADWHSRTDYVQPGPLSRRRLQVSWWITPKES